MNRKDIKNQMALFRDYCRLGETKTVICMVAICILEAVRPYVYLVLMGRLLDLVYSGAEYRVLLQYAGLAFGYALCSSCAEGILHKRYNRKLEYMYEQLSYMLDRKCQTMDYEYLEDKRIHDLIFQIDRGSGTRFGMMGAMFSHYEYLIRTAISVIAAVVIVIPLFANGTRVRDCFITSWLASLLLFVIIGILTYINYHLDVRYGEKIRKIRKEMAKDHNMLSYYMGMLSSYEKQKDLRVFGQRRLIEKTSGDRIDSLEGFNRQESALQRKSQFVKHSVSALSGLLVYVFAGIQAYMGLISIGSVVTYASSIIKMTVSMAVMMQKLAWLRRLSPFINDYAEFMDMGKVKYNGTIPIEKRRDNKFSVEFEHVSFRYPGSDTDVIKDLNLKFTIGEKMAIVGKNGSGKTTFIKLLCRLYDVTEGCIKVNGVDIRKYDYQEYCNLFAVVFQDFKMFDFPLGENIAAGEDVDLECAMDSLERAGLGDRVSTLPEGLNTYVGKDFDEGGVTFSGGEKQKMAIARAIYKDAPFVIMDEPTAALDPVSECEVFDGFDKLVGNKTAIYISHRLASCRFCEDILVFDQGQVVQRGSHEELENQEGLYRELWNAQAQYYA